MVCILAGDNPIGIEIHGCDETDHDRDIRYQKMAATLVVALSTGTFTTSVTTMTTTCLCVAYIRPISATVPAYVCHVYAMVSA